MHKGAPTHPHEFDLLIQKGGGAGLDFLIVAWLMFWFSKNVL